MAYNYTGSPCVLFKDQEATVAKIRLGVSYLALSLCVLAGIVLLCGKLYHKVTHRLYGYLTIANIAYSIGFTVQYFAQDYDKKLVYHAPCVTAGFLMQYTGWVVLLLTSIIIFHLFVIIVFNRNISGKKTELCYILSSVCLPLLFCWIPFVNDTYGLSGNWCWIRWADFDKFYDTVPIECPLYLTGLIEKLVLWSGPIVLFVLLSSVAAMCMIIALIVRARRRNSYDDIEEQYCSLLSEVLPFLTFPVAFYIICILEISYHIHYALHFQEPNFGLWLVSAVCEPIRAVPTILVLFCPGVVVRNCKRRRQVQKVLEAGELAHNQPTCMIESLSSTTYSACSSVDSGV